MCVVSCDRSDIDLAHWKCGIVLFALDAYYGHVTWVLFFVVFVVCSYEVSGKSDGNPGEYYRMFHLVTQSAYW